MDEKEEKLEMLSETETELISELESGEKPKRVKQTKKELFFEFLRVLIVSGGATAVDWIMAYSFYGWILPPSLIGDTWSLIISTALGFVGGLIVNWLLSVNFAFRKMRDKEGVRSKKSFFKFSAIGVVGLIICELGMLLVPLLDSITLLGATEFLGAEWGWWIMKVTMACTVFIWNYLARKFFVFKA